MLQLYGKHNIGHTPLPSPTRTYYVHVIIYLRKYAQFTINRGDTLKKSRHLIENCTIIFSVSENIWDFVFFSALHCTSISMSICVLHLHSRFFWYTEYDGAIFIKVPWSLRGGGGSLKLHHHIQRIREYMRFCIFSAPHCTSISMSICVLHLYSRFFWYTEYDGAIFIKVPWSLRGGGVH